MVAFNVGLGETVFLFFKFYFSIVCTHVLPAFMYVHYMSAWCLRRSEEAIGSSGTGVKDGYELPWGTSSKLLTAAEPSFPPQPYIVSQLSRTNVH